MPLDLTFDLYFKVKRAKIFKKIKFFTKKNFFALLFRHHTDLTNNIIGKCYPSGHLSSPWIWGQSVHFHGSSGHKMPKLKTVSNSGTVNARDPFFFAFCRACKAQHWKWSPFFCIPYGFRVTLYQKVHIGGESKMCSTVMDNKFWTLEK